MPFALVEVSDNAAMRDVDIRTADIGDVDALARIRSAEWGTFPYWQARIRGYMLGERNPGEALPPRMVIVAVTGDEGVGFIAGHRTRRHGCEGELQWLDVTRALRRTGVATELLRRLALWFARNEAKRVCVDVDPGNAPARAFYTRNGAAPLNPHWLVWEDVTLLSGEG